ncbi:MAG: hypothetical protein ACXWW8_04825 [Solirubrobacterales bacterium]
MASERAVRVVMTDAARGDARGLASRESDGAELAQAMAAAVLRLEREPYGDGQLRGRLSGYRKLRFDTVIHSEAGKKPRFRFVYRLEPGEGAPAEAVVLAIGGRGALRAYEVAQRRVNR